MTKKKRLMLICLMVIVVFLGLLAMLYPMIASRVAEANRSEVRTEYEDLMQDSTLQDEYDRLLKEAESYNRKLFSGEYDRTKWTENGYYDMLRLETTDVMAYIRIPRIDVILPVYHGTEEESALHRGVGHLEASSLPVGGENTHAVLSAHTGMAESRMFTDLELLEPGDIFYIDILGQTLAYQIMSEDDITVVLPSQISNIAIERGEDLVTLVTCTPYGVNTHRLLVKGHRIDLEEAEELEAQNTALDETDDKGSVWTQKYINAIINGILLSALFCVVFILIVLLLRKHDRKRRRAARAAMRAAETAVLDTMTDSEEGASDA